MASKFSTVVQQIKESADIVAIIGRYVQLKPKGNNFWGLSPFKTEKTASFCVYPNQQSYYCYSTSQGGDVFNFVEKIDGVDFKGAVRIIAREMGIDIEEYQSSDDDSNSNAKVLDICMRIDKSFNYLLLKDRGKTAYNYLLSRGFTEDTIQSFHIGYAPPEKDWLYNFLKDKGYADDVIADSGLFSKNYERYTLFRDRIMFPIMTPSGNVIAYGGRIISGEGPKYINSPETNFYKKKKNLYGLYQSVATNGIRTHKKVYVVEGYFDVMALHQAGLNAAVAPLGTAFTPEQAQIIRRYTDYVVLVFDTDEAGFSASLKSAIICERAGFSTINIVRLSENDPGDILQKYGKEELCEQILDEQDFFDFYIEQVFPPDNMSMQEREAICVDLIDYVRAVQSEYKVSIYMNRISDVFRITQDAAYKILSQRRSAKDGAGGQRHREEALSGQHSPIKKNREIVVLAALCTLIQQDVNHYQKFRSIIKYKDFDDLFARKIYSILENLFREGVLDYHNIMQSLEGEQCRAMVEGLIFSGEASKHAQGILDDYIFNSKILRLKKRSKDIDYQLRIFEKSSDSVEVEDKKTYTHAYSEDEVPNDVMKKISNNPLRELLVEKKFINDEIMKLFQERGTR